MRKTVGAVLGVVCLLGASWAGAEPVKKDDVEKAVGRWIKKSPHFKNKKTPFVRQQYRIKKTEKMQLGPFEAPFYAVELEPVGFVIMNSDARLPPVLAYSDSSVLDLTDSPPNTFRFMLKRSMQRNDGQLKKLVRLSTPKDLLLQPFREAQNSAEWAALIEPDTAPEEPRVAGMSGVTNGPFLTTSWNQCNHYNELCPDDPDASAYYDGHVPVGCVAVVGAQIMNFYEWPFRGKGGYSYTDSWGSITGVHSVVLSDPFDWQNMQDSYNPWGSEPAAAVAAVSELMYEAGVAVEMDYEHTGSGAYTSYLSDRMNQVFLYESSSYTYTDNPAAPQVIADQIRADVLADRPACVTIPGHAVVADGHVDDGVDEFFHINYGWGGANDGWYLVDDIAGDPAVGCISGIYPALIPLNVTEDGTVSSSSDVQLEWAVAASRTADVQSVSVLNHVLNDSTFTDSAEDFSFFSDTSTDRDDYPWIISNEGYSGYCFRKESPGWGNREYHLTSVEKFVPQDGSLLKFRLKTYLGSDVFRVMVSDDDGQTFFEIGSYDPGMSWVLITEDLSSYAGSEILIRFEYVPGGYYIGGGVWLDDIEFSGGGWYGWETVDTSSSVTGAAVTLPAGTNTLALQAYDGSEYGDRSPSFTVVVENNDTDGDGLLNWWEELYFGGTTNAVANAVAANAQYTVMECYIAGINPADPNANSGASLAREGTYRINWNAVSGRVYSVYFTTNLMESFQPLQTNIVWPQSSWTDAVERAEVFYKLEVQMDQ